MKQILCELSSLKAVINVYIKHLLGLVNVCAKLSEHMLLLKKKNY